jgi:hypothetical protein
VGILNPVAAPGPAGHRGPPRPGPAAVPNGTGHSRLRAVDASALRRRWWPAFAIAAGLAVLYAGAMTTGFVNDDYLFLEQARRYGLIGSFLHPGGVANHFRPLSREVWFSALSPLAGGEPLLFHLAQFAVLLGACALLVDLLRALVAPRGPWLSVPLLAGALWYATLPFQRVNLLWASCSQDLLALLGSLAALALFRRGRTAPAVLCYAGAVLSKQSALPLPLLLFLWSWRVQGEPPRRSLARTLPFLPAVLPWAVGEWVLRTHSVAAARLTFDASSLGAALMHGLQSLFGVEHASGWLRSWADARPSVAAFSVLALAALGLPASSPAAGAEAPSAPPVRVAAGFALTWIAAFLLPLWPVAYSWSGYYYTLAAAGGAILVALAARRLSRWGWVVLAGGLLWWHAAGVSPAAFAVRDDPWVGTSHVTAYYLERAAALSADLRAALRRRMPRVPHETRFFFATLPSWAGFQMGNGASVRHLYHDDSLESFFYSAYSETTAARHDARFLYWDGRDFTPLYANAADPLFQVGSDLLLLDRPAGAMWAFRRGLESGGERLDHWYWLGWAALWSGHRPWAERAWREWGARDDSTARIVWLRRARGSLEDGDTLRARRELVEAVRAGIGHPEAHAMLGLLLLRVNAKYALLETLVASELKPSDWLARRDLVAGLVAAHLDDPASGQLARLQAQLPDWRQDSVVVRLDATLRARRPAASEVAIFQPGGLR